ncbi:hypothetical protein D3C84_1260160 [compost metagenome]
MRGLADKVEFFRQTGAIRQIHFHRVKLGVGLEMLTSELCKIVLAEQAGAQF